MVVQSAIGEIQCKKVRVFDAGAVYAPKIRRQLNEGIYEEHEAGVLEEIIRDDDVVMEVGAGVGYLSTLACLSRKNVRAYCYEAHPGMIDPIEQTHRLNSVGDQTSVKNAVLMTNPTEPTLPFYAREQFWASSLDGSAGKYKEVHDVQVLDANVEVSRIRPTVFVCDIEGGEAELIPNLNVSTVRHLVIEIHPRVIGRQGVADLITVLQAKGLLYDAMYSERTVICFSRA